MPGEPAETMIGVGALGFGIVLIYAAFKNVSPSSIILSAVRDGKIGKGTVVNVSNPAGGSVSYPVGYTEPPVAAVPVVDPFIPPYVPPHGSVTT